jgi:radical SAM-linked protein
VRVRLRFTKLGKVRFISHRDVARVWERALRRAELPLAYTEGFSPRPKVSFGLALSTGYESLGEYLDVELDTTRRTVAVDELPDELTPLLPEGIDVAAAAEIGRGTTSLQEAVTSCTWRIDVGGADVDTAAATVQRALRAPALVLTRERKGKPVTDDLRPQLLALSVVGPAPGGVALEAELGTHPRTLRPSELLTALDPGLEELRVCRTHQWSTLDGARREPLPVGATWAEHARERAS